LSAVGDGLSIILSTFERPEVSLLISGTSVRRRPRGELVLEVPPAILGGGQEPIRRFLEQAL